MNELQKSNRNNARLWLLGVILIATIVAWFMFRDFLTLETLAQRENELRQWRESSPVLVFGLAFLFYVVVTGLALPGAAALSLVYAWFFGFWPALLLISLASTLGATLSFLLSRFLFRESIQNRFRERLKTINSNLENEGVFYLFTLRLIPAVPFFVINLVMGLTPMKTWTFWWVSQIGMLPGTAVFVYAGSSFPSLDVLAQTGVRGILRTEVLIAFVILGLFPLAVRKLFQWFGKSRIRQANSSE